MGYGKRQPPVKGPENWTEEEDRILEEYYPKEGFRVKKRLPGRSAAQINKRAARKGLKLCVHTGLTEKRKEDPWTKGKDGILTEHGHGEDAEEITGSPDGSAHGGIKQKAGRHAIRKKWTDCEDEILREYYPAEGAKVERRLPERTKKSIKSRASVLGITREWKTWTEEEDDVIRKSYNTEGKGLAERLPGRSGQDVASRARELGIRKDRKPPANAWTPEEDSIMIRHYEEKGAVGISQRLPGRSFHAIRVRARHLGLDKIKNRWTEDEDEIIRKYYPSEGSGVSVRLRGRTSQAVRQRARTLGIMARRVAWTEEEDNIIREYYEKEGKIVTRRLPGRSEAAVITRASILKVGRKENASNKPWTVEEDRVLKDNYPIVGMRVYEKLPGRTKSAVKHRVQKLGITHNNSRADKPGDARPKRNNPVPRDGNKKRPQHTWTEEEEELLKEHYPNEGMRAAERLKNHSWSSVQHKVHDLELRKTGRYSRTNSWSEEEEEILRQYYPTEGIKVAERLKGRSKASIHMMAVKLKIKHEKGDWTPEEDGILREYYMEEGISVRERLPGRTGPAIIARANKLGMKRK